LKRIVAIAAFAMCLAAMGCFHATIDTGLAANDVMIKQPWASCWILGLVPPKTVEAAAKCPGGVSKVSTQRSFLNMVVGALTFGIYTPMEIMVTCSGARAEGPTNADDELVLAMDATPEQISAAYGQAATLASQRHAPVYVRFVESVSETSGS